MWFEIILVLILFKFKKRPNISGIRVVQNLISVEKVRGNHIFSPQA